MTATRDPRADISEPTAPTRWDERPIAGPWRGLPWWAVVLIGFGLAAVGAVIDIETGDEIGAVFKTCYVIGAVAAIAAVRRRSLFAPMVQPPLIVGIVVPGVVLVSSGLPEGGDTMSTALTFGRPLINAFPIMAITTGVVLVIGLFRLFRERDPQRRNRADTAGNQPSVGKQAGKSTTDPTRADRPQGERARGESGSPGPGGRARRGAEAAAAGRESQAPSRGQPSAREQPPAREQPSTRGQPSGERQAPGQRKPAAERENPRERPRAQGQKPPPPADRERQRRSQGAGGEQRDRRQQGQQQRSGKQPPPEAARSGSPQQPRRPAPPDKSEQPRRSGQPEKSGQPGRPDQSGKPQRPDRRGQQDQRGQQGRPNRQGNSDQPSDRRRRQPPPQQRQRREDDQPPPRRRPPERPWE